VDIEAFISGHYEKGYQYSYFVPELINKQWEWKDPQIGTLLEKASFSLGELNSFARLTPNIDLFIQLHVTKEAVVSSRIEGTQTNMDEAIMPMEEIEPERRNDWLEVRNYTDAMKYAINELKLLPISSRLLCQTHEKLLSGTRGEHKSPGEFRRSQNWIGGTGLNDAIFIPPSHIYLNELMSDLENFLHNETIHVPELIRIGIAHYQFETIHPFLDGNGRIGRLLITLYLVSKKILNEPLLCLSIFFEKNRNFYYNNLNRVRSDNDLIHWLKYFLIGIDETAKQASDTLSKVMLLKKHIENTLQKNAGRRTDTSLVLLNHLFIEPIIRVNQVETVCDLSTKAANDLVNLFVQHGILKEISGKIRYRRFLFENYINLFK